MNAENIAITTSASPDGGGFLDDVRQDWRILRHKGFFFGLLVAWLALFYFVGSSTLGYVKSPSIFDWLYNIYSQKTSDDAHGKLIPFVVLALFWWKRKELLAIPQKIWWPALLIIVFSLFLHVFGFLVQQPIISLFGMYVGVYGLIGLTWGFGWLKASFFPFILFAFCMPVGGHIETVTLPLRLLATNITYGVTHGMMGLGVIKKGTQLFDANGSYSYDVAAACSGIRSLISLLALTTIYAMITFKAAWKRILVIVMAVPLAVASNVLRLTSIVVSAEAFGQKAGDFVHEWSGFLTYAVAIIVMMLLGSWLNDKGSSPAILTNRTA